MASLQAAAQKTVIVLLLAALFVALSPLEALATPGQGGFYPLKELSPQPQNTEAAFASTRRLSFDVGVSCSSAVVSNDGYVLTALHCLTHCMDDAVNERNSQDARAIDRPGFTGFEVLNQEGFVKNCPAKYIPFISEPDVRQVRLVWVGHGRLTIDEAFLAKNPVPLSDVSRTAEGADDYVILKIDYVKEGDHPCYQTDSLPKPGEPVWNIGYPSWAERPGRRGASGAELVASVGQALSHVTTDPVLINIATGATQPKFFWDAMDLIYGRTDLLRTDADAYFGNSGGAQVNSAGKLVAVLSSVTKATQDTYNHATVIGTSLDKIRGEVAQELGPGRAQEIFNCHPVSDDVVQDTLKQFYSN